MVSLAGAAKRNCSSDTNHYLDNALKSTVRLMPGLQLAAGGMKISMVTLDHFPRLTGTPTPVAP